MNVCACEQANDALLLELMRKGSCDAFNSLYEKYWDLTYNNAYKRLNNAAEAQDIVQEIFVNIWLQKGKEIHNLPAYLNIAVRNQVLKLLAKKKLTHPFFNIPDGMPASCLKTDADILLKEFNRAYELLIKTLPHNRQIIFRLRYQEDLPTKDIARQLGLSRKTVQNQLGKATEQLRISLFRLSIFLFILLSNSF